MSKPIYHWTKSDTIEKIKESKYYKIAGSDKKSSLKKRIYGTDNIHQPKNLLGILNRNDGLIIFVGKASRKFKKRYVFAEFTSLFGYCHVLDMSIITTQHAEQEKILNEP